MNNTKWREVWSLLAELRLQIRFAYAGSDEWNLANSHRLHGPFPLSDVLKDGIRDPGIGGPFRYKDILWIRVPHVENSTAALFRERLETLGRLPVRSGADFTEIRGYDE